MRVLFKRTPLIEWAGELHAYPLVRVDDPDQARLVTAGEDEAGWKRVGWKQFFGALERRKLFVIVDSETELRYRLLPLHLAELTLPKEAFGPPWWKALAQDVCTAWPKRVSP